MEAPAVQRPMPLNIARVEDRLIVSLLESVGKGRCSARAEVAVQLRGNAVYVSALRVVLLEPSS
jgi:hypothetical protein